MKNSLSKINDDILKYKTIYIYLKDRRKAADLKLQKCLFSKGIGWNGDGKKYLKTTSQKVFIIIDSKFLNKDELALYFANANDLIGPKNMEEAIEELKLQDLKDGKITNDLFLTEDEFISRYFTLDELVALGQAERIITL